MGGSAMHASLWRGVQLALTAILVFTGTHAAGKVRRGVDLGIWLPPRLPLVALLEAAAAVCHEAPNHHLGCMWQAGGLFWGFDLRHKR